VLKHQGWAVGKDRVQRIWRREGLKVPQKQPKRGRLWLNDAGYYLIYPAPASERNDSVQVFADWISNQ